MDVEKEIARDGPDLNDIRQIKSATTQGCCTFLLVVRFCCLLVGIDWSLFTKAVEVDRGCLKYYKAFGKVKNQIWLCCSPGAFFLRLMVTS